MHPNPFLTIWTAPRETVRRILATDPDLHVILLVCLAGVGDTLDRASSRSAGDKLPLVTILFLAAIVGPLGGLLSMWIYSHLVRWTGSWIGGIGERRDIRTALAWALVPAVAALLLWIPMLAVFGMDMFTSEMPRLEANPALKFPLFAVIGLELVLGVWTLVLMCHTVAEAQNFESAWRGLGNLLLAALVFVIPLLLIGIALAAAINR